MIMCSSNLRSQKLRCTARSKLRPTLEGLESRQLLSNFYLVNEASGLVLDDPGSSTTSGQKIQQFQLNGGSNQQWQFILLSNGNFEIRNAASGLVLDDPGSSTTSGQKIQQYQWHWGSNQQWQCLPLSGGNVEIRNAASGLVLDDPGSATANGKLIQQYQWNGGYNQQWRLLPASGSASSFVKYVANGSSGKVLDDTNSSMANGTSIQQYQYNGGANQQWVFVPLANGDDLIVNAASGKVLDDPGGSTTSGQKIQQYELIGGYNQQWQVLPYSNGNFQIVNAASGLVLDDPGGSMASGTSIQQYQYNGGLNQQWALFMPNTSPGSTPNWSGYVAATNLTQPKANSVSSVSGTWLVPKVTGPSTGTTYSLVWVGIDGFNGNTVEQIGTEQDVVNGSPVYSAWWEMYSSVTQQPVQPIKGMTIMPGDSITASVQYISSGTHAGQFYLSIVDNTRSNDSFSTYQTSSQTQNPQAQRSTAEWIVEAPTDLNNNTLLPLANFGAVTFTQASAVISGTTGSINASSWQSEALNMVSNGATLDRTSVLTNAGSTFVVIDTSPSAAAAVGSVANVAAQPPASPAAGVPLQPGKPAGSPVIGGPARPGASGVARFRPLVGDLRGQIDLSTLPRRSWTVFDVGDANASVPGRKRIS
jgi:hypothetical protein